MAPNRIPKPNPAKALAVEKLRKDLEPSVRASFLASAILNLSEHAAKGGKDDSLGKKQLLQLFEVSGALAKELSGTLEPSLMGKVHKFKEAKLNLRKEVLQGISPPSVTNPLQDSEWLSDDLFPKDVFLKVDEEAMKTDDKNFFPNFASKLAPKRPVPEPFYPPKKRTRPAPVYAPVKSNAAPHESVKQISNSQKPTFREPPQKEGIRYEASRNPAQRGGFPTNKPSVDKRNVPSQAKASTSAPNKHHKHSHGSSDGKARKSYGGGKKPSFQFRRQNRKRKAEKSKQ